MRPLRLDVILLLWAGKCVVIKFPWILLLISFSSPNIYSSASEKCSIFIYNLLVGSMGFLLRKKNNQNSIDVLCVAAVVCANWFSLLWLAVSFLPLLFIENCKTIFAQTAKLPPSRHRLLSLPFVSHHLRPPLTLSLHSSPPPTPPALPAKAPSRAFPAFARAALLVLWLCILTLVQSQSACMSGWMFSRCLLFWWILSSDEAFFCFFFPSML